MRDVQGQRDTRIQSDSVRLGTGVTVNRYYRVSRLVLTLQGTEIARIIRYARFALQRKRSDIGEQSAAKYYNLHVSHSEKWKEH